MLTWLISAAPHRQCAARACAYRRAARLRNPYLRLLCQLYKFLARRSESKFNKVRFPRGRALAVRRHPGLFGRRKSSLGFSARKMRSEGMCSVYIPQTIHVSGIYATPLSPGQRRSTTSVGQHASPGRSRPTTGHRQAPQHVWKAQITRRVSSPKRGGKTGWNPSKRSSKMRFG